MSTVHLSIPGPQLEAPKDLLQNQHGSAPIKTAGLPLPQDLLLNVTGYLQSSDLARVPGINKEARDLKREIILDNLANCTALSVAEFNANKALLGKKDIVPELETRVLPPLAGIITDLLGSKKDDLELSHCENLRKFDCAGLNPEDSVKLIPELPPSLTEIVNTRGVITNNNDLRSLLKQCPRLESISLNDASWVNDETVGILVAHAGLRRLCLMACPNMTNAGLKKLLEANPQLEHLDIQNNKWVNDTTMQILAERPDLKHVNLSKCPNIKNDGLKTLLDSNPLLTFDIHSNRWVDDKTMELLAVRPGLRNIDLHECMRITDNGLKILLDSNPQLEQLNLEHNYGVLNDTMKLLAAHPGLRRVDISNCNRLYNSGLRTLLGNERLTHLNLRNLERFDNTTMSYLALHSGLKELDISQTRDITNYALRSVLELNPKLTKLTLSHNGWVNDEILKVLANFPLKEVNLLHCLPGNNGYESVNELRKARPDMIIRH